MKHPTLRAIGLHNGYDYLDQVQSVFFRSVFLNLGPVVARDTPFRARKVAMQCLRRGLGRC